MYFHGTAPPELAQEGTGEAFLMSQEGIHALCDNWTVTGL